MIKSHERRRGEVQCDFPPYGLPFLISHTLRHLHHKPTRPKCSPHSYITFIWILGQINLQEHDAVDSAAKQASPIMESSLEKSNQ